MGIIKISDPMHENLRLTSAALSRSINAQADHWLRVGMLSELNPNLRYDEICRLLIQAEHQAHEDSGLPDSLSEKVA
ncbi:MAG: ParD-like family protein [Zoogloea sp.]|uniref:ParD-like family protein n=1 Tax=Zoogloea sp. TaxID=49181 RepID=UPI00263A1E6E|nr:ParD-like family protein [Zoogloea sp.]MDD2987477.1 ParD-like family protein [Zoogloea sp.]